MPAGYQLSVSNAFNWSAGAGLQSAGPPPTGYLLQSYRLPYREQEGHSRMELRDLFCVFLWVAVPSLQNPTLEPTWRQPDAKIASKSEPGRSQEASKTHLF